MPTSSRHPVARQSDGSKGRTVFKPFSEFLYRTPWWALILLGCTVLLLLGVLATPFNVIGLQRSIPDSDSPAAVRREVNAAMGQNVLAIGEAVVKQLQRMSSDPAHKEALDRAMAEIERVRAEMVEAARTEADQSGARAAVRERRRAIAQAQADLNRARRELRSVLRGAESRSGTTSREREESLEAAIDAEKRARDALAEIRERPVESWRDRAAQAQADRNPGAASARTAEAGAAAEDSGLSQDQRRSIRRRVTSDFYRAAVGVVLILLFIPGFIVALIAKVFVARARSAQALAEQKRKEAEIHNVNRQLTEARLQALQAQIEPHFLYNTLANVQALTEVQPETAGKMVGHLIQYLRASLPRMRGGTSTVGQEVELAEAYLNILKIRMGERLDFSIDVSDVARSASFPPLILQSLVENAIKHGLEPQREGGRIAVSAHVEADRLRLSVRDTGRGLRPGAETVGGGVGLTNIRERLSALYGPAASLDLAQNPDRGATATVILPVTSGGAGASGIGVNGAAPSPATLAQGAETQSVAAKAWSAAGRAHRGWGSVISSAFVVSMILVAVLFGVALAALLAGHLPVTIDGTQVSLEGLPSMALGSLGLFAAFSLVALAVTVVIAAVYGLGLLFAGLVIFVPVVIVVSLVPTLAPLVLIGLVVYWIFRKRRKPDATTRT